MAFINVKKYDADGEHPIDSFSEDDNLIIKGNNLLALHSLKERYLEGIDCIYIDPPYNVASSNNSFMYNNRFNHSTWLTFMKNRLEVAKKLLRRDDGVLIIAIDENEVNYLGVLLEEIFVEYEKHLITVIHNPRGVQGTNFSYNNEFLYFVFPRGKKLIENRQLSEGEISLTNLRNWGGESLRGDGKNTFFPILVKDDKVVGFGDVSEDDFHPKQTEQIDDISYVYPIDQKGIERKWRYARQTIEEIKDMLYPKQKSDGGYEIMFGKNFGQYKTVWQSNLYDSSIHGKQLLNKLVSDAPFSFPKSVYAVKDALYAVVKNRKYAKIIDFFGGSGTTAHAVQMLNKDDNGNRSFVIIEQMDYINTVSVPRLQKVIEGEQGGISKDVNWQGGGSFVYAELMELNQIYMNKIDHEQRKVRLSRKKLTEEEALECISKLSMQLQNEQEMLRINLLPHKGKSIAELDSATAFCLLADHVTSIDEAIEQCKERIACIQDKMYLDYARFVSSGTHVLSSGYLFRKADEE